MKAGVKFKVRSPKSEVKTEERSRLLHPSSLILHPFFRRWSRAILAAMLVCGGMVAALATVLASRAGDVRLTRSAALLALLFVALMVVFVVPPLARSARGEVAQLDLPIQITTSGLIFLGIFLIVAFAAWNTGNNLLFLIFSVLTSTLFVAWAAGRASLRELRASARFPDHIFAGEPAPVVVTLHNAKRLLPSLSTLVQTRSRVITSSADGGARESSGAVRTKSAKSALAYFLYVPHKVKAEQRIEEIFPERGHIRISGFELSTGFPCGFLRLRRRLTSRDVDLIIYPKPEAISDELHLLPITTGQRFSARRSPEGHDLHSLRDYQAQDDLRHIDWKATARARRLMVREFTAEDERRVHIWLDTQMRIDNAEADQRASFERGVVLAASLAQHFIEEQAEVRLTLGAEEEGRTVRYGATREHLYDALRRLAVVQLNTKPNNEDEQSRFWERIANSSSNINGNYVILLTTAPPGSIPPNVWRTSHVIHL